MSQHDRAATPAVPQPPVPLPTAVPDDDAAGDATARPLPLLRPARGVTRTIRARPSAVQGTLALEWTLPGEVDAVPAPIPGLRLVTRAAAVDDTDPAVAVVATSRAALPDPGPWTAQLVQAVLEVLAHERPRHQLARWLTVRRVRAALGAGRRAGDAARWRVRSA